MNLGAGRKSATNREVFETYLERVLAPALRPAQVVVMDNLSAHEGERVRELIEGRACELPCLPPYPPDFIPIEEAFSKIKGLTRKARSREGLVEAIGAAISQRSLLETLVASSNTVATIPQFNRFDFRCRTSAGARASGGVNRRGRPSD